MKQLTKYIFVAVLFLVIGTTARAQKYSLYYTRTLYDGIQNPHHRALDSCRSFSSNFFIFPSLGLDFSLSGEANDFVKAFLASENLTKLSLENGGKNSFNMRMNYNIFMMKIRLSRKREAELSFYSQLKSEAGFNINNGIFNFLTKGNYPYRGQSIDGFLDIGGLGNFYVESGIGFRRQIYGKLSGGFKVGYIIGIANATVDVKDSKFYTSTNGDTVKITIGGDAKLSVDPNNTSDIASNILKNNGFAFSGGLQYDLTRKMTLGLSVLDLGAITWNENSRLYKLGKTVTFTGVNALDSVQSDSVMKDLTKFATDSSKGKYTSPLLSRVEFSLNYRWANWFHQTAIVSKPIYNPNLDVVLINNIRFIKRFNFIFLGAYNTSGFASVGAQFLYRAKGGGMDFYIGSEKVLNTYQVSQQLADHTRKPTLGLGADINFGVSFAFGRCPKPKPQAPSLPGDADSDGVMDVIDDCPYAAGPIENKGCPWPDTDKDGVLDKDDACIDIAGPADNKGCPWPDADNDSIPDKDDKCPNAIGLAINNGCPDTDGDGIYDDTDACIDVAGAADNKGCPWPDTDGDGVLDKDDKCPNVKGPVDSAGCPGIPQKVELTVEEQEVINKVFSNLTFQTGKTVISASSYESLDLLSDLLIKKPSFKLLIEGHTDNVGKAAANMKLSQTRSDAVKKYIVGKGIDAARITAKGYGQTKPVADNKTAEGRAQNRRVEFTILE